METITVPIKASYQIIDGKPVMVSADYANVPVDAVARLLMHGFGVEAEGVGDIGKAQRLQE